MDKDDLFGKHLQRKNSSGTWRSKAYCLKLSESFTGLQYIVENNKLNIKYHIAYDDAGKVGIGLCSEIDGRLNWYIDKSL